ncbi:replication-associated recombination protein A [Mesomycoplasma lagogenitalium]|uniref:Replication-associated recombination protein A n=1 Tax=Mesomycoplasma lagogenitalium TaxID=171286 RepID=A0ABY8LUY9_9BACT|nr:replication-associated recombination protein A [Mesomycoplasma lagogenitalium]
MKNKKEFNFYPENLNEIIGQEHLKFLLKKIIELKDNTSFIFYGESGIGKTSTAKVVATNMNMKFDTFNASIENKESLISKINDNEILIIDEIHRLNKDKQDILLSFLENKKIIIYATTTENPYFKINPAIRSRMQILKFEKPNLSEIKSSLFKLVEKNFKNKIEENVLDKIIHFSNFDIRNILSNLKLLMKISENKKISNELIEKIIPNINFYSDKNADAHYNNLSAFHKSLRGSDVDASLYYGMLIIKTGDFEGLYRRILCVAYEDVGLANSIIALKAKSAIDVAERIGMPEAILPLGNIIIELALSPKSNSTYSATKRVLDLIESGKIYDIPNHLKDDHYKNASKFNHGVNYKYPHDYEDNYIKQQYLPNELTDAKFFEFSNNKNEMKIKEYWDKIKTKN